MIEIKLHGRGGQGVVMASQILGMAFFKKGMYPQCYSLFGAERRGAPVVSFIRVNNKKIFLKCNISNPNEFVYFDESLFNLEELENIITAGSKILCNTNKSGKALKEMHGHTFGMIDATGIAASLGLNRLINTTILGAYCRFTGNVTIDYIIEATKEMIPIRTEINIEAIRQGYANLVIFNGE